MGKLWTFLFLLSTLSCRSTRSDYDYKLSDFIYNGRKHNRRIINRVPDYGFCGRDGCIVQQQISLVLTDIDDTLLYGRIINEPCNLLANRLNDVSIYYADTVLRLYTDSIAQFWFAKHSDINKIEVSSIMYRKLVVDVKGLIK